MAKNAPLEWTADKIAGLTVDQVKTLRDNAAQRKVQTTVDLCDADLARRRFPPGRAGNSFKQIHTGEPVQGFHFVCPSEKGITRNPDGTAWTGTWVVDKNHAERAVRIGAYLALHTAKSKPSYLQGVIRDWRVEKREPEYAEGQIAKTKFGIDFLIELTDCPVEWHGDGAGEKGYFYSNCNRESIQLNSTAAAQQR
jgi:hypothetical protein